LLQRRLSDLANTIDPRPNVLSARTHGLIVAEFEVEAASESDAIRRRNEIFRRVSTKPFADLVDVASDAPELKHVDS